MNVPSAFLVAAFHVIDIVIDLYIWLLIIGAVMSWLVSFGVINMHNRFVQTVSDVIHRLTDPVLQPIRRILPPMGGLDLSPLVLILLLIFTRSFLRNLVF